MSRRVEVGHEQMDATTVTPAKHPDPSTSESRPKPSRRRDKPQLSCTLCRQKKLKCDRNQPCKNCEKRPLGSCVYVHSSAKPKAAGISSTSAAAQSRSISVQDRIRRLERLVVSLAETPKALDLEDKDEKISNEILREALQNSSSSEGANGHEVADPFGRLSVDESETRYLNPSHWEALLDDITELKDAIASSQTSQGWSTAPETSIETQKPALLFGAIPKTTVVDLLCSMPGRHVCDELVDIFLRSIDIPPLIIHVPTFKKEYEAFWENPKSLPVTWIALLHTLISLALQFTVRTGLKVDGIPFPEAMAHLYTTRAAQCLIIANYTKPTKYTIEAMVMYLACEHFQMADPDFRASLLFAIVVRLAVRTGYHRDPKHYPEMSIFDGEMRRRIWALIKQLDLLFASANGLPRLIDDRQVDTAPPMNLLDEDLCPEMTQKPIPRAETEQTWIGYLNYKVQMLAVLGRVVDSSNSVQDMSYSEVLSIDKDIQIMSDSKPSWLELPATGAYSSLTQSALTRLMSLDLIFQRARMILHRKFLVPARGDKHFTYSRQACLKSATQALYYQRSLEEIAHPDGLVSSNWRFFTLMAHDFLLAAMIICLDLDQDLNRGSLDDVLEEEKNGVQERFSLLESSYTTWTDMSDHSSEARKAAEVLRVMLEKVRRSQTPSTRPHSSVPSTFAQDPKTGDGLCHQAANPYFQTQVMMDDKNAPAISPMDMGGLPVDNGYIDPGSNVFQTMLGSSTNFDWVEWDSHFPSTALDLQQP